LTYIPNPENKPQINHKDGKSLHDYVDNLEWVTQAENMKHACENGLMNYDSEKRKEASRINSKKGEKARMRARRIFSFAEANYIRTIYKKRKNSCDAIARIYRCAPKTINNIVNNKTYLIEV